MSAQYPNCPFYGSTIIIGELGGVGSGRGQLALWHIGGNRCAAMMGSHTPCQMEIEGKESDWRLCKVIGVVYEIHAAETEIEHG